MSMFNEPYAAEEFFVDEWGERELVDGIFSVTGFRIICGERRAVVRLLTRVGTLAESMEQTSDMLNLNRASKGLAIAGVSKLAS